MRQSLCLETKFKYDKKYNIFSVLEYFYIFGIVKYQKNNLIKFDKHKLKWEDI